MGGAVRRANLPPPPPPRRGLRPAELASYFWFAGLVHAKTFGTAQRALWFALFTGGFFFLFYLAAAGIVIPILRLVTWPLRLLPNAVGAVMALAIGGGLGIVVLAAVQSTKIATFAASAKAAATANPGIAIGLTMAMTVLPMVLGLLVRSRKE